MTAADPRPLLDLPPCEEEIAFRAIETILREYPVLDANVKTWSTRRGADNELQVPAPAMMPLVGLSPVPNPIQLWGVDMLRYNFAVSVQLFVPGTCSADILGLWAAVRGAIQAGRKMYAGTPGEISVQEFCCSRVFPESRRGLINLHPYHPAFFPVDLTRKDNTPAYQMGVGSLLCFFAITK